jgi:hypothetical protein
MERGSNASDAGQDSGNVVWVYSGAPDCCVYKGHADSVICLQSRCFFVCRGPGSHSSIDGTLLFSKTSAIVRDPLYGLQHAYRPFHTHVGP